MRLSAAFDAERLRVADNPDALEPDQVLVLEIAGELDDFVNAVQKIDGFEFLAEEVADKIDPDDFAALDKNGQPTRYARQLFLVATDASAWQQLLALWERFQRGDAFPHGLTPFRNLFERLRVLRPWDDRDRLERTGALTVWERELVDRHDELIEFEIELWLRSSQTRRDVVLGELRTDLESAGGHIVSEFVHPEIDYHGVLGRVPAYRLLDATTRREVRWLRTGAVRFFHAAGQMAANDETTDPEVESIPAPPGSPPSGPARVALLDGLPIARHVLLSDRLVVDDPDGWESTISVDRRMHGTGMASVVLHGDLNDPGVPLPSPLYVRPILSADAPAWVVSAAEELPRDRLPVDFLNAAVARLFEGEGAAPEVRAIVIAVGDRAQQFDRFVSPLARLLDWLAFRYEVLFLLSAGNHFLPLDIPAVARSSDPQELQHDLLCALGQTMALRRLLSPAESINAITVGAAHADSSAAVLADDRVEPFVTRDLPNFGSAVGTGVRRAVKPDILLPGGRQLVRLEPPVDGRQLVTLPPSRRAPGVRLAAPGREAGILDATHYDSGTSIAAAMAGHHAGHLLDHLATLRTIHGNQMPGADLDSVIVKAALVHGARWGSGSVFVHAAREDLGLPRSREAAARVLGYGLAAPDAALVCDDHRVTVIGGGRIVADEAHTYSFPLPPSLAARTDRRRVTLTLAWLTPTNARHRYYRRAALKLEPRGFKDVLGERTDADTNSARRGTVQHDVLTGAEAVPYAPGSAIELVVSCRADAGALESQIPYVILATLEVPAEAHLPIYEEVRQALRVPVAVRAR